MIEKYDFVDMSGDLPSGWEERTSRSTGQTYFLNQVDKSFLALLVPGNLFLVLAKNIFPQADPLALQYFLPYNLVLGILLSSSTLVNFRFLFLQFTKQSTWDRPTEPATEAPTQVRNQAVVPLNNSKNICAFKKVRGSHLLVKHKDSRRPASWRQDPITRTKVNI